MRSPPCERDKWPADNEFGARGAPGISRSGSHPQIALFGGTHEISHGFILLGMTMLASSGVLSASALWNAERQHHRSAAHGQIDPSQQFAAGKDVDGAGAGRRWAGTWCPGNSRCHVGCPNGWRHGRDGGHANLAGRVRRPRGHGGGTGTSAARGRSTPSRWSSRAATTSRRGHLPAEADQHPGPAGRGAVSDAGSRPGAAADRGLPGPQRHSGAVHRGRLRPGADAATS